MEPAAQVEVEKAVEAVVRRFVRRRAPAREDDMRQEAWKIALSSLHGFDPAKGTVAGYVYRAVTLSLGNSVSRWLAVPSIGNHCEEARLHQTRVEAKDDLVHRVMQGDDPAQTPEDDMLLSENKHLRAQWRQRMHRALDSVLRGFAEEDRRIVDRLFGLDGLAAAAPKDVAADAGRPVGEVYRLRDKAWRLCNESTKLFLLERELEDLIP